MAMVFPFGYRFLVLRFRDEMRSPTSGDAGLWGGWDAVIRCCLNAATRHRTGESKLLPSLYYSAKTRLVADKPCPRNRITESGQVCGKNTLSADDALANLSRVSGGPGAQTTPPPTFSGGNQPRALVLLLNVQEHSLCE